MANIPEEIVDGSVTQLTHSKSEGVRMYVPHGDSESISQGMGSGFIIVGVNEFLEASGGMRANSVSVPEGVVNGVRINGVSANGVSRAGRESVVNGVGLMVLVS
ncbi:hypothetical protein Tco_1376962 [Tanacetum coccineum]